MKLAIYRIYLIYFKLKLERALQHFNQDRIPDKDRDNVLGIGTTVIPPETGDLGQYMKSLDRLLEESPGALFPAHGPRIDDGPSKIREYIQHRLAREEQILQTLRDGHHQITTMVSVIYAAYPKALHAAAGQSVASHLLKLEAEGRVVRQGTDTEDPVTAQWSLTA